MKGLIPMDIKISNVYSAFNVYNSNNPGVKKANKTDKADTKDSFSMSVQAGDYQAVRKALAQIPDNREEKTAAVEARISAGEYVINPKNIAAKMFQGWNA
jgi:flagellar biosynthesis anti-sigma factor FlgM